MESKQDIIEEIKLGTRAVNYGQLRQWYENEARTYKRNLKINMFIISVHIMVWVVFIAPQIIKMGEMGQDLGMHDRDYSRDVSNGRLVLLTFVLSTLTFFYPFFITKNRLNSIDAKEITEDQFLHIWDVIAKILVSMNLEFCDVKLFYLKTDSYDAHVLRKGKVVYLYLSRNMFSYYTQDKQKFEAIIGHELGHVFQRDTRFLILSGHMLVLPVLIIIGGIIISWLDTGSFRAQAWNILPLILFMSVLAKRKQAEYLADIASIVYLYVPLKMVTPFRGKVASPLAAMSDRRMR